MPKKRPRKQKDAPKRPIPSLEDGQEFCVAVRCLGSRNFTLRFHDRKERLGHLAGRISKRQWVGIGSWVIASMREFQDDKCDIIEVLTDEEHKKLAKQGEIDLSIGSGMAGTNKEVTSNDFEWEDDIDQEIIDAI